MLALIYLGLAIAPVTFFADAFTGPYLLLTLGSSHTGWHLEVASPLITADGGRGVASCYQSPVRLRFYRLDFQRQDLGQRR
jgi:hypothetical protein